MSVKTLLAARNSGRIEIPVIGDSITAGYGVSAYGNRYVNKLNGLIRGMYPTSANGAGGGYGFVPLLSTVSATLTFTWPVTASGTIPVLDIGPVRGAAHFNSSSATTTCTFTAPAGTTSVRIMWFNAQSSVAPGSWSYQVGSGTATVVTSSSTTASGGEGSLTPSIPLTAGQVLTIKYTAGSGSAFPEGIIHYAGDENTGITFHACGHSGWNATTSSVGWRQTGAGYDWRPSIASLITGNSGSGALCVNLGPNDWDTNVGNETAATFTSNLQSLITYLRGNATLAGVPLLLVVPPQDSVTYADPGGYAAYAPAVYNTVAAWDGNAEVVNVGAAVPSVASNPSLYVDSVHPNDAGAALYAQAFAAAYTPARPGALMSAGIT